MSEEWRDVPGYERSYQVSNLGRVRALDRKVYHKNGFWTKRKEVALKQQISKDGYHTVGFWTRGKMRLFRVHRLVMLAFIGLCPDGLQVNHKNGIKTDNRLANLEYVTLNENMLHAARVMGVGVGERNGQAKLKAKEVIEIRRQYHDKGRTLTRLSRQYGVHISTIYLIVNNKKWRHLLQTK